MDIYFLFNKETQENIGFSMDPKSITGGILWRKVKLPESENLRNIKWEGNYGSGKFVRVSDTNAVVTEYDVMEKFYDRLFRKFSIEEMVRIMMAQFIYMEIPEEKKTSEFKQLLTFFSKNVSKLNAEIQHFKDSPDHDFESKEQIARKIDRQFKS